METTGEQDLFMVINYPGGERLSIYQEISAEFAKKLSKLRYGEAQRLLKEELSK